MDGKERKRMEEEIIGTFRLLAVFLAVYVLAWFRFHWVWVVGSFFVWLYWKNTEPSEEKKKLLGRMACEEAATLLKYNDLPKWVRFPDTHRAEWLNQIMHQMWPFISNMVSKIMKDNVEPEIIKNMPTMLKTFHFIEVDLGHMPVTVGGINVYTDHVKPNEIVVDVDIMYAGDAIVKVGFHRGITAGISDLRVRGMLRIELGPLLSEPPLIGAVTLYFLETPKITFNMTDLLNVLDIPGLNLIIKRVIGKVIEGFAVFPQRITVPIAYDDTLLANYNYTLPLGVLYVKVLGASDLQGKDVHIFTKNTSDVYVKVKLGDFKYKTSVVYDTVSPEWKNESFTVFVEQLVGTKMHFTVMDEDKGGNDLLGSADKDLEELAYSDTQTKDRTLSLGKDKGSLHCVFEWCNFTEETSEIKECIKIGGSPKFCLFVKLEHAQGLPEMSDGTCSPFVEITVGKKTVNSKTMRNTSKPIWNELHYLFVDNLQDDSVKFKVRSADCAEALGSVDYHLSKLLQQPGMKASECFSLHDCFTDAVLSVTLELKGLKSKFGILEG